MAVGGDLTAEYRIEPEEGELEEFADEYAGSKVAVEATGSSRCVNDMLDQSMEVSLGNPSQTRGSIEANVRSDSIDAKMLAQFRWTNQKSLTNPGHCELETRAEWEVQFAGE